MLTRTAAWLVGSLLLALQVSRPYPVKAVQIVEPFGAGGGVDTVSRIVAKKLSEIWQQPVTVDNRPGAGSTTAPALVAKSAADGYTLLANSSAQAYSAALPNLPYDPLKDFVPVAALTSQAYVLVAGPSSDIFTVADLVRTAKAKPGQLTFGSPGVGTGSHVGAERFNAAAGIKAVHVAAVAGEGIVEIIAKTVAGHTTYLIAPIPLALADIRAGRLRALGVTTKRRSPLLPEVASISEAGVSGFDYAIWYGVWAPVATPPAVVDKLAADIARALDASDVRAALASHGAERLNMPRTEFARFVIREAESARRIVGAGAKTPR